MQNVLPISGVRAYTVSDDASADQRYLLCYIINTVLIYRKDSLETLGGGLKSRTTFGSSVLKLNWHKKCEYVVVKCGKTAIYIYIYTFKYSICMIENLYELINNE